MNTYELLKPEPGLRVLITGAASGIGAALAQAFLQTQADVCICDVDPAAVARFVDTHPALHGAVGDVSDVEQVDAVIDHARQALGGLDLLVNNAGIAGPTGPVEALDPAAWDRTVATNLNSQFYFLRRAVPLIKATSTRGSIITMSSVAGRLGYPYRTPYAATKWALVGLMRSLAIELGPSNVRVNAILPGVVEGERMDRVIAARADSLGVPFDTMRNDYLNKISLRRMVTVTDIAAMALFLASPAAVNLTGQAISVDGNLEYL
ncbi:SDR family oxidoreductase [Chitinasiproducens palmae]|uniref:NAD(P)-dependent dehydrogenase, short-chain alcohol dehydrogenase family n=1 Tax=Chitinasiproducens palmae TaxID=1770053 RepID=A0A1H2PUA2_9BURK|nr:SDR family oxidoreductase [Chitinasiproducens palmae]SDV50753.1 NAD(P)-dependent dehydrogenase, short-chain alcohol dehydrogenase family [Chitinasiproducens palmae]